MATHCEEVRFVSQETYLTSVLFSPTIYFSKPPSSSETGLVLPHYMFSLTQGVLAKRFNFTPLADVVLPQSPFPRQEVYLIVNVLI